MEEKTLQIEGKEKGDYMWEEKMFMKSWKMITQEKVKNDQKKIMKKNNERLWTNRLKKILAIHIISY